MASKALISSASPLAQVSNKASSTPFLVGLGPKNVSFSSSSSSSKLPTARPSLVVRAQQYEGGAKHIGVSPVPTPPPVQSPRNTTEDEHELKVRLDMPGLAPEDIDVKVEGDMLVVKDLARQLYSPYDTRLQLPHNIMIQNIKASLKNGVLHIIVPKLPKIEPYVIHVPVRLL